MIDVFLREVIKVRRWSSMKKPSLAARMMADGVLDVDLASGELLTHTPWVNRGGYVCVSLKRERGRKVGRAARSIEQGRVRVRYRERMTACVHRLVVMKSEAIRTAVLAGGCSDYWRLWVCDLPRSLHVDHLNFNQADNRIDNLRLLSASENCRRKYSFSKEEEGF